jgi:predicted dinucleotide-binding enzyme
MFQQTGANNIDNLQYADGTPLMFLCGDDHGAKRSVAKLSDDLGFEAIDTGKLEISMQRTGDPPGA